MDKKYALVNQISKPIMRVFVHLCEYHKLPFYFILWRGLKNQGVELANKSSMLIRTIEVNNRVIFDYDLLSFHAGKRDIRSEREEVIENNRRRLRREEPIAVKLFEEAACIFESYGVLSIPFVDVNDPRLVEYLRMSFRELTNGGRVISQYCMIDRGGMLGESDWFTTPERWRRELGSVLPEDRQYLCAKANEIRSRVLKLKTTCLPAGGEPLERTLPHIDPEKTIFVPLHCSWDEQLTRFSPLWGRNYDFLKSVLEAVPADYTVLVKEHPYAYMKLENKREDVLDLIASDRRCVLVKHNVHDIIPHVRFVVVVNSSVGIDAIFHNKPVLVGGKAFYSFVPNVGIVPAHYSVGYFQDMLRTMAMEKSKNAGDGQSIMAFIGYLWNRVLVRFNDSKAFESRMAEKILPLFGG